MSRARRSPCLSSSCGIVIIIEEEDGTFNWKRLAHRRIAREIKQRHFDDATWRAIAGISRGRAARYRMPDGGMRRKQGTLARAPCGWRQSK